MPARKGVWGSGPAVGCESSATPDVRRVTSREENKWSSYHRGPNAYSSAAAPLAEDDEERGDDRDVSSSSSPGPGRLEILSEVLHGLWCVGNWFGTCQKRPSRHKQTCQNVTNFAQKEHTQIALVAESHDGFVEGFHGRIDDLHHVVNRCTAR